MQEDVEPAEPLDGFGHDTAAGLRLEQVGGEDLDVVAGLLRLQPDRLEVGLADVDDQHPAALGGQGESACAAEPAGADDEAGAVVELQPVGSGHQGTFHA